MTRAPHAETPPAPASSRGVWKRRVVNALLLAALVPAALVSALGFFGKFHWIFDLCAHFRAQYTLWFASWTIAAILLRRRDLAVLGAVFTLLNLIPFSYYHPLPRPPARGSQHDLRVVTFNLCTENERKKEALSWLEAQDADLILLTEYSSPWIPVLRPLQEKLPHVYQRPGFANYGFAIFSKFPLEEKKYEVLCAANTPCLTARTTIRETPVQLFVVHPLSPVTAEEFRQRNEYLENLAARIKVSPVPVLAAGDFNVTAFSPFFSTLRKSTRLRDAARGRGFHPTYDHNCPAFGIPIDHILHSPRLQSVDSRVGPPLGSDHKPVVADFVLDPTGR